MNGGNIAVLSRYTEDKMYITYFYSIAIWRNKIIESLQILIFSMIKMLHIFMHEWGG